MMGTDTSSEATGSVLTRGPRILKTGTHLATASGASFATTGGATEVKGTVTKVNASTTSPGAGANDASMTTGAEGASWACCVSLYTQFDCNGAIDTNIAVVTSLIIPNRIILWKGSGLFNADTTSYYGCASPASTTTKMSDAAACAAGATKYGDMPGTN